jgi:hypothetical protein
MIPYPTETGLLPHPTKAWNCTFLRCIIIWLSWFLDGRVYKQRLRIEWWIASIIHKTTHSFYRTSATQSLWGMPAWLNFRSSFYMFAYFGFNRKWL